MASDNGREHGGRLRAARCVALVVGFYAVALLVVGVILAVNAVLLVDGLPLPFVLLPSALVVLAIVSAVLSASFKRFTTPPGVWVGHDDAPGLMMLVEQIAARAEVPAPSRVLLVDEANAFVREDCWFLGLWTRQRVVGVGWPLLMMLTTDEVAAVLGHEMGHFAKSHTRSGPFVYRAQEAMNGVVSLLHGRSLIGSTLSLAFASYRNMFLRASRSISRDQERDADELAVSLAGTDATVAALRALPRLALAHARFRAFVEAPWWQAGKTPINAEPVFAQIADAVPADSPIPAPRQTAFDTHPSIPERLAAIVALPPVTPPPRPTITTELVPRLSGHIDTTIEQAGSVLAKQPLAPAPAAEVLDAVLVPAVRVEATRIMRKAHSMRQCGPTIESAFTIYLEGRQSELVRLFHPELRTRPSKSRAYLRDLARPLVMTVLVDNSDATWRFDPRQGLGLRASNQQPIDVNALVETLLDDPAAATIELARYGFSPPH